MKTCRRCYADNEAESLACRTCGGRDFINLVSSSMLRQQLGEDEPSFERTGPILIRTKP